MRGSLKMHSAEHSAHSRKDVVVLDKFDGNSMGSQYVAPKYFGKKATRVLVFGRCNQHDAANWKVLDLHQINKSGSPRGYLLKAARIRTMTNRRSSRRNVNPSRGFFPRTKRECG